MNRAIEWAALTISTLMVVAMTTGCAVVEQLNAPSPTPFPSIETPLPTFVIVGKATVTRTPTPSPTITPLPSSTATSSPTMEPTSTPASTSVPTPTGVSEPSGVVLQGDSTLPDNPLLEEAGWLQRNGDYEAAIAIYQQISAQSANAADAQEALYQVGRCYILAANPSAAIEPLRVGLEGEPSGERRRHILFALGEAYGSLGDKANAVEFYQAYLDEDDTIAGYVRPLIGDSYVMLGELNLAIRQYELALQEDMPVSLRAGTMENLADIALQQQDYLGAIGWYDEILAMAQYSDYRSRILYQAALAHQQAGQMDQALSRFHESVNNYPDTYHAYLSLEALLALDSPVDEFKRGMVDYYNGIYEGAIAAFHRHIEAHPDDAGGAPWYYSGLSYGELGRYSEAQQELDRVIWGDPTDAHFGQAWIASAMIRGWSGDLDGAIEVYRNFAISYPSNAWADDALWEAANLTRDAQRAEEAAQLYLQLQDSYPDSEYATRAFFQAGLSAYREGSYEEARRAWQSLETVYPWSDWVIPSLLWRGKTYLAQGDGSDANAFLDRVAESDAHGYYGYRGLDLSGVPIRSEASMPLETEDEARERLEFESWLVDWVAPGTSVETLSELSPALAGDDDLVIGRELWAVGRRSEAASHFRAVRDRYRYDAVSLYQLCLFFLEEDAFDLSISCGEFILGVSPAESVLDAPDWLRRMIYPTLFSELVIPEARARDVDPFLFLAIIRQESRFNPFATSYADARGLTQVIPDTANYIAMKMGDADITPSDMYRPMVGVRYGVYYLAEQINRFDGDIFSAMAAYNGGPTNAERWYDPDVDILVENIRYRETRAYVQAVYEQYRNYRALYSTP